MSNLLPSPTWRSTHHGQRWPASSTTKSVCYQSKSLSTTRPIRAGSTRAVRVPGGTPDLVGRNVVVIADDGPQWFRLRSLTVRGTASPLDDNNTYRVAPRRVVAWDYGSLREASAPASTKPRPAHSHRTRSDLQPLRSAKLDAALRSSHVMIVATRSRKGAPFAVPLWFVVHDGRIYAGTSASSWTVRNVIDGPQVCVLFGGERGQGSDRLLVRGHAQAITEFPPAAVLARTAWRYYLRLEFAAVELVDQVGKRMRHDGQAGPAHAATTLVRDSSRLVRSGEPGLFSDVIELVVFQRYCLSAGPGRRRS